MTDVLFVHAPKFENRYPAFGSFMSVTQIPAGLPALAARAEEAGAAPAVVHLGIERIADARFSLGKLVRDASPRAIGVAIHFHPQAHDAIRAVRTLRANAPDAFLFAGGLTASVFAREILETYPHVDAVIRGDAEAAVEAIARRIPLRGDDLSHVPNAVWRRNGAIADNGISFVAGPGDLDRPGRARLNLLRLGDLYARIGPRLWFYRLDRSVGWNLRVMGRVTGHPLPLVRGCPFSCIYCGGGREAQAAVAGRRRLDVVPVGRAAEDAASLASQGVGAIFTEYVPLCGDDAYWLELLRALADVPVSLNVECRSLPSPGFVEAFAAAFGPRPGSRLILSPDAARESRRGRVKAGVPMTDSGLETTLRLMERLGVCSELFFSVGLPGETPDDVAALRGEVQRLRRSYRGLRSVRVHSVELDPGSPMQRDPAAFGLVEPLSTFEDYRRHHARGGSMLSDLGYGVAAPRAAYERRVQETICADFCRLTIERAWRLPGQARRPFEAAARAACAVRERVSGSARAGGTAEHTPY